MSTDDGVPTDDDADRAAEAEVARVADEISDRIPGIIAGMRAVLGDAIAELVGDHRLLDLLGAAIEGNVATVLTMLRQRIQLPDVEVPPAAVVHARRLAQQGVPVFAMMRAYRLGQGYLLAECFTELSRDGTDPQLALRAYNAINVRVLSYIDWVSQEVVTAYETERDQWVRNRDAVRAAQVQELLVGRDGDLPRAEESLRYRLNQHHLAAILWTEDDTSAESLGRLEAATGAVADDLGGGGSPLTVAADGSTAWVWFPRGAEPGDPDVAHVDGVLRAARIDGVRVALGGVEPGVAGFRASHRQADEARRVLVTGDHPGRAVIGHREPGVSVAALLADDLDRARVLVHAALGPLAADDDHSERLRDTLLGFLGCGSSYTATAARHALHKNSVRYRIEKAVELRGRPLGEDRIDVELALVACRWLGSQVLDAEVTP